MTIEKKLLGTNPVSGEVLPEAVSFDGATDYLARTSDLTSNTDSKTFTFSAWVYWPDISNYDYIISLKPSGNVSFYCYITPQGRIDVSGRNASGTEILSLTQSTPKFAINTFVHILISVDLANTSNRYLYVNDVLSGDSLWNTYTNSSIDFTVSEHRIFRNNSSRYSQGRAAHVFLDYTYRDLSTTSNRRLFIDADGKPSDTIPSNPIMYLPMKDAATAGSNSGTGGDFTVNGVLATAERGPNQDNCSASKFDGSNDYLTRASIGASNSKLFTVSGTINVTGGDGLVCKFYKNGHGTLFQITTNIYGSLFIKAFNAVYQNRFYVQWKNSIGANNALKPNHNYHFSLSVDMSNTSKRHLIINGAAVSPTYTHYTNVEMGFSAIDLSRVGFVSGDGYFAGDLGELYFNTTYTDLSADNPFWDSDTNRPNSVRKVIADTSVTPLVALPLLGNDAGNNLGSGGDFNVVSGPFTGARGGSEFYARSLRFDNTSNGQVSKTSALTGNSTATTITIVFAMKATNLSGDDGIWAFDGYRQYMYRSESGGGITWHINNTSGNTVLSTNSYNISNPSTSVFDVYLMSCDLSAFQAKVYKNGVASGTFTIVSSPTGGVNAGIADKAFSLGTGEINGGGDRFNGDIAAFYYDNSYQDFSQEANRNKFVDQLGFLKDLTPAIEAGDIPNPLIYLKFDPTVSFGTNSGRGGNFNSVGSSVISGDDMKPS